MGDGGLVGGLLGGPLLQDVVAELAHRVDHPWLGHRRLLDIAARVLDEIQHPFDLRAQPGILVQPRLHIRPAEDRRFAVCEPC